MTERLTVGRLKEMLTQFPQDMLVNVEGIEGIEGAIGVVQTDDFFLKTDVVLITCEGGSWDSRAPS